MKNLSLCILFSLLATGCISVTVTNESDNEVRVRVDDDVRLLDEGQTETWETLGIQAVVEANPGGPPGTTDVKDVQLGPPVCFEWNGRSLIAVDCP